MWLEVGETDGCMVDAMYYEPGCGWRYERQSNVWCRQCVKSQDLVGGSRYGGLYDGGSV